MATARPPPLRSNAAPPARPCPVHVGCSNGYVEPERAFAGMWGDLLVLVAGLETREPPSFMVNTRLAAPAVYSALATLGLHPRPRRMVAIHWVLDPKKLGAVVPID